MSIEAESVAVKEEVKIKEECDDELLDILPSTSKLIPEDDKEAIQASLKIDPEQDLKLLAGTSQGEFEYDCFEEKQFKMENVESKEEITSEDEDQSDSESEDLSDEAPPKIKSEELIIKSESAVDSDASTQRKSGDEHKSIARDRGNCTSDLKKRINTKNIEVACDLCGFKTKCRNHFYKHMKTTHGDLDKKHVCNSCGYKTYHESYLNIHMLKMHQLGTTKKFVCELCYYKTDYRIFLNRHKENVHLKKTSESAEAATMYVCSQCDYRTRYKSAIKGHLVAIHWKNKPYKRNHKVSLPSHTSKHDNNPFKKYKCDSCTYFQSNYKHALKRHKLIHEREAQKATKL